MRWRSWPCRWQKPRNERACAVADSGSSAPVVGLEVDDPPSLATPPGLLDQQEDPSSPMQVAQKRSPCKRQEAQLRLLLCTSLSSCGLKTARGDRWRRGMTDRMQRGLQ